MALVDDLTKEIELRLGGQMVDVELDPEHYELSIKKSFEKYRQRSENSVEEAYVFLELKEDIQEYTLPTEIVEVRDILTRTSGTNASSGNDFEPFEAAYLNTYLLAGGRAGGLATFDALQQHRETLGKLFGSEYLFTWNVRNSKLTVHRKPKANTSVVLWVYKYVDDESLLTDIYAGPWLKEYSLAHAKLMLAEARGKFNTIAGPQGGTSLNSETLRADAQASIEKLEQDLRLFAAGESSIGYVTIG